MLTIISLLGGSGAIGAALFFMPGLREALLLFLRKVPARVWYVLIAVAAVLALILWHNHAVDAAYDDGRADERVSRDAQWRQAFDEMSRGAEMFRQAYEAEAAKVSELEGSIHAENLRRSAAAADDLRLRGPGQAAACSGPGADPGIPAAPGGHQGPASGRDDPADRVPAGDRQAIVPWGWLINRAEDHDELLSEVTAWRSWYDKQKALHDDAVKRLKASLSESGPEFGR